MGKCPNCGASYLLSNPFEKCNWCGKFTCLKCLPIWPDSFPVKTTLETGTSGAKYERIPFCSKSCADSFWQTILKYPLTDIGTDIEGFEKNLRKLFYSAILSALKSDANIRAEAIDKVNRAIEKDTENFPFIPLSDCPKVATEFAKLGYNALALNLEKCGRTLDAARIYEEKLKLYDKARLLRQNDKQVIVKHTDVSINLNELLRQVKEGGIVAIYRCPHCNGTLKVNDKTSLKSLKTCEHCGSEIETVDLADFLKTAIS
jgi:hypothetical protein